jgi:hypothetical protein
MVMVVGGEALQPVLCDVEQQVGDGDALGGVELAHVVANAAHAPDLACQPNRELSSEQDLQVGRFLFNHKQALFFSTSIFSLGMHRILILPDIWPAGYPANPIAGYRISGRILDLTTIF